MMGMVIVWQEPEDGSYSVAFPSESVQRRMLAGPDGLTEVAAVVVPKGVSWIACRQSDLPPLRWQEAWVRGADDNIYVDLQRARNVRVKELEPFQAKAYKVLSEMLEHAQDTANVEQVKELRVQRSIVRCCLMDGAINEVVDLDQLEKWCPEVLQRWAV